MPTPKQPQKRPRRARGTGSIFQVRRRGKVVWVARVPVGGKTRGGHTRYREISDASQAKLVERLKRLEPPGDSTTLAEWCERWLDASRARDSTRDNYRYTVRNYIAPTLGHIRVSALSHTHCDAAVRQWLGELGPGTTRLYLATLRACLNAAIRAGLIGSNPASQVKPPKVPRRTIEPMPPQDISRLITAAMVRPNTWILALLAATGMRIGEALALDVGDYDPRTGLLTINKTWTRQHGSRAPKSENGNRVIRVPESARPALVRAIAGRTTGPLFQRHQGQRWRPQAVREAFDRLQERLGLVRRNPHQLRHSFASLLVASGESIADCARFLGDSTQTVIKNYLHPTSRDPSLVMDRLLSPEPGKQRRG